VTAKPAETRINHTDRSVATCECVRTVSCCVTLQINYEFEYATNLQKLILTKHNIYLTLYVKFKLL